MVNAIGSQGQNAHTLTIEGLDGLVEKGHLQAHIRPALNAKLIHRTAYEDEPCTHGEGQVFTVTKEGDLPPEQDATPPPAQTYGAIGLDAGLTPVQPGYERYDIVMHPHRDTIDHRLSNSKVTNLNKIKSKMRILAKRVSRTLNLAYRRPLTIASKFGHAYVLADDSSGGIVTAQISNLGGFHKSWVAGNETPVSPSNPVRATILHNSDVIVIDVTAVTIGSRDDKSDLTPGTITFTVVSINGVPGGTIAALSEGDPVIAKQASVLTRPNGKSSSWALDEDDTLKWNDIVNQAANMLSNGVEGDAATDKILVYGDYFGWAALMKDPDFQRIYRDRYANDEFVGGAEIQVQHLRMVFGHDMAKDERSDGSRVRSIVFCGQGAGTRAVYTGADPRGGDDIQEDVYLNVGPQYNTMFDPDTQVKTVIRKPIDRGGDVVSVYMEAIIGTAAQPDTLTGDWCENPDAAYKRLGSIEFIG